MYRTPHDEHEGMKVWLSESEMSDYLDLVEDTTHRIALSLGVRCGLRSSEIIAVTSADVVDGPAGTMLRVRPETAKGGKYRETSVPPDVATTILTVEDVRPKPSDAPLVDVGTRTLRGWVDRYADEAAETYDDEGWRDLSANVGDAARARRGRRPTRGRLARDVDEFAEEALEKTESVTFDMDAREWIVEFTGER